MSETDDHKDDPTEAHHKMGDAMGTIQTVLGILTIVGQYAPTVFQGIQALIADFQKKPPTSLAELHERAAAHHVDVAHVMAFFAKGEHLRHKGS